MQKNSPPLYFSAILFDRDGTLIEDKHYLADPLGVELLAGSKELVAHLAGQKRLQFVVSNQSGIGRGMFDFADADACNEKMVALLELPEPPFAAILYCPHEPGEGCRCRKPATGMWEDIQKTFPVKAEKTLMVGDKQDDLLFAHKAGLGASALVLTGKGQKTADNLNIRLAANEDFLLFPAETRPGFPQLVARDCFSLLKALAQYEEHLFAQGCL